MPPPGAKLQHVASGHKRPVLVRRGCRHAEGARVGVTGPRERRGRQVEDVPGGPGAGAGPWGGLGWGPGPGLQRRARPRTGWAAPGVPGALGESLTPSRWGQRSAGCRPPGRAAVLRWAQEEGTVPSRREAGGGWEQTHQVLLRRVTEALPKPPAPPSPPRVGSAGDSVQGRHPGGSRKGRF